ncbi:unnamed protein product [Phytophthora fragariaefolia]|uniref:Unnamed protein product n=1 Tax=Phytophthora fragariaefolia TaxID=1490495 RepID=A0A9W6U750_9STRA|nr:unnamed protein product [Phytophthora fragariaefolia]
MEGQPVQLSKRGNDTTGSFQRDMNMVSVTCGPRPPSSRRNSTVPRQFNNVTFQTKDIMGLLSGIYYGSEASNDTSDQYGSHPNYSYRDLTPGFFHIAAANLLGLLNSTFVIVTDAGYEV